LVNIIAILLMITVTGHIGSLKAAPPLPKLLSPKRLLAFKNLLPVCYTQCRFYIFDLIKATIPINREQSKSKLYIWYRQLELSY
jgi:hypothetical protein